MKTDHANYKFRAQLFHDNPSYSISVPCEIYLPDKIGEQPKIVLLPEKSIHSYYSQPTSLSLHGEIGQGLGAVKIIGTGIFFGSGSERYCGDGLNDRHIMVHADTLQVIHSIPSELESNAVKASFYITESLLLQPFDSITQSYNGNTTNEKGDPLRVKLSDNIEFIFENEYRYRKNGRETIRWAVLSAKIDISTENFEKNKLLSDIDDFLLIVSFAENRKSACLEMRWTTKEEFIHEYRMNRVIPPFDENHSFRACLIPEPEILKQYLGSAFLKLREHPQFSLIHGAIAAVTQFNEGTIGSNFIRIFSALESLVLAHRRINNLEFSIEDSRERKNLENSIKKAIKENLILKYDQYRRKLIYDNISGLFRISLRQATESFISLHAIDTSDIWPLFDSTTGISLIQIRNKIAHGENFSNEDWWHIAEAEKSLRLLVNRCVLSVLGTSYQATRAGVQIKDLQHWNTSRLLLQKN